MIDCFRDRRVSLNTLLLTILLSSIVFLNCKAETAHTLTGYIHDDDNLPLQGAVISLELDIKIIKQSISDKDGYYNIEIAPPVESYYIHIYYDNSETPVFDYISQRIRTNRI